MSDLISRLRLLDRTLAELSAATALLGGVPEEMRALHDEHVAATAEIAALAANVEAAALARRTAEGAVADAQEKLKKYQQQVSQVRNQREYGAILSEIDQAKTSLRALEEGALAAIEEVESSSRELAERRETFGELDARYQEAIARWEKEKPAVAARAADLEREAAALRAELPRPVVAQFLRISDRLPGGAMAAIRLAERPGTQAALWHCAACNSRVRPQVALEIRNRGTILQCDNCRRFLYAEDEG
jgi:predicted  nucleic acid-binding Zn-ribbon protein